MAHKQGRGFQCLAGTLRQLEPAVYPIGHRDALWATVRHRRRTQSPVPGRPQNLFADCRVDAVLSVAKRSEADDPNSGRYINQSGLEPAALERVVQVGNDGRRCEQAGPTELPTFPESPFSEEAEADAENWVAGFQMAVRKQLVPLIEWHELMAKTGSQRMRFETSTNRQPVPRDLSNPPQLCGKGRGSINRQE